VLRRNIRAVALVGISRRRVLRRNIRAVVLVGINTLVRVEVCCNPAN
jgi:hypothetical protein